MGKRKVSGEVRVFESGATRDSDNGKLNYSKGLCPNVLKRYMVYLQKHRTQSDGTYRNWDNWKLGIPQEDYIDSLLRHSFDLWRDFMNGNKLTKEEREDLVCAIIFNSIGFLFEDLRKE